MDFAMQEWSTIVVGLLIVVVLLHAIKSILASRSDKLRSAEVKAASAGEGGFSSELPNGGARVIGQRFDETAQELNDSIRNGYVASRRVGNKRVVNPPAAPLGKVDVVRPAASRPDGLAKRSASQSVPLEGEGLWDDRREPSLGDFPDILMDNANEASAQPTSARTMPLTDERLHSAREQKAGSNTPEVTAENTVEIDAVLPSDNTLTDAPLVTSEESEEEAGIPVEEQQRSAADSADAHDAWADEPQEWLILNLAPPKQYVFTGKEFFVEIEKAGFTYAKNGGFVFTDSELNQPLFYLANGTQPGTFPPDGERDDFETASLCFVLALPAPCDALRAFVKMDECAETLASALQGQLTDDEHSHYTAQTREHYRQRALQFDRSQLSQNYS